jgi:octaprenyl-diphosphate synthase
MVHLATLVHDDVMDGAKIRRGRPTMAAHWGNEISVLLGDCLFAHALKLSAGFPTTEICRAVSAATNTVCSGEILQTQSRKNFDLTREKYFKMLQMKTGELFALSCDLGAYLSGAGVQTRNDLRQFGLEIGTAYQVFDDCVDVFGSEALVGKSLGTDLATGKVTLPILLLLENTSAVERARWLSVLRDWHTSSWQELLQALCARGALNASKETVQTYLGKAREALWKLPESSSRAGLLALTHYVGKLSDALGQGAQTGI